MESHNYRSHLHVSNNRSHGEKNHLANCISVLTRIKRIFSQFYQDFCKFATNVGSSKAKITVVLWSLPGFPDIRPNSTENCLMDFSCHKNICYVKNDWRVPAGSHCMRWCQPNALTFTVKTATAIRRIFIETSWESVLFVHRQSWYHQRNIPVKIKPSGRNCLFLLTDIKICVNDKPLISRVDLTILFQMRLLFFR